MEKEKRRVGKGIRTSPGEWSIILNIIIRVELIEMTIEQRLKRDGGGDDWSTWGNSISSRGNSQCKVSDVGERLESSSSGKEANVV